jgi:hypothetical protein
MEFGKTRAAHLANILQLHRALLSSVELGQRGGDMQPRLFHPLMSVTRDSPGPIGSGGCQQKKKVLLEVLCVPMYVYIGLK